MPLKIALVCASAMLFTYVGYPLLTYLLSRVARRPVLKGAYFPRISVILPIHNESERIASKVHNIMSQSYPRELMELIIVDDGSDVPLSGAFLKDAGPGVRVITLHERKGKASALNAGAKAANGEVVVFTDARQTLARDALTALVANFADQRVSAVTGRLSAAYASSDGLFRVYEERLRSWEAAWGSCVGSTGALYAVRKSALAPISPDTILDDLVISLSACRRGRLVYERDAVACEADSDVDRVWPRRLRTLAGNWQIVFAPVRFYKAYAPSVLFQLFCHKGLRLAFPFLAVTFVVALMASLPFSAIAAYAGIFVPCVFLVVVALGKKRVREIARHLFVAPVAALIRYLAGLETVLWAH